MKKKVFSLFTALVMIFTMVGVVPEMEVGATQNRTTYFSRNYTLGSDPGQNMVIIAFAQKGKTGSDLGYSEDWCANFVSDCADLAGQSSAIPRTGAVNHEYTQSEPWYGIKQTILRAGGVTVSSPQTGDIIIFSGHVEIVTKVSNGTVYCIGGNNGGTGNPKTNFVRGERTASSVGTIKCYLRPNYNGSVPPTPVQNDDELGIPYPRPSGSPLLSTGSKGSGVSLAVDGDFGSGTKQAVINFQKSNGLDADGIAGLATINKLVEVIKRQTNPKLSWAKLTTQDNRTVFGIGEQVQFKMSSDNAKYYVIGIDYEGERIVTSPMAEGYDLYCYGFNFTGNYAAYVSAYYGDNHIESNVVSFKVVEKVDAPTWATLTTQDNRTVFEIGEQVQFKMNSDNAKYYVIGIDYEGERIVTSPMADGYDLYCYAFNFTGNYTAYVSAYNGNNHIESNVVNFKVAHSYGSWTTVKAATCTADGQEERTCSLCGEKETRTIAATGHEFCDWVINKYATCTSEGEEVRMCWNYNCTETEKRAIPAKGHKYTTRVIFPTFTEQGYDLHTCSECGDSYKDNYQPMRITEKVSEVVLLQKYLVKKCSLNDEQFTAADLNNDGTVNVFDVVILKRRILKG